MDPPAPPSNFAALIAAEEHQYLQLLTRVQTSLSRLQELSSTSIPRSSSNCTPADQAQADQIDEAAAGVEKMHIAEERVDLDCAMSAEATTCEDVQMMEEVVVEGKDKGEGGVMEEASVDIIKTEEDDFPELLERAKKLLARISMAGDEAATASQEVPAKKEMYTEAETDAFWGVA